jgi:lipopolysaccharide assembly outer membrane protein LptD (OstA)
MKRFVALLGLLLMIITTHVMAADEPVQATGDRIWGDTQKKLAFLEGNVRLVQGETILTTTRAEIDLDRKIVVLTGAVKLVRPDVTITAEYLQYDLRKKDGTFRQKVVMERRAVKAEPGKSAKDPFTLSCVELVFESESRNFIAKGEVAFEHKDFNGKAAQAEYDDSLQQLIFTGDAYLKKPEGEEIRGGTVKINLKERSFLVEQNVTLSFRIEEENKPMSSPTTSPTSSPKTSPTPSPTPSAVK